MKIILKAGRERSLKRKHPWIFSGAVHKVEGRPKAGDTIDIYSNDGVWLAKAAFSPSSQIIGRIWSFENKEIDEAFFAHRISQAFQRRHQLDLPSNAYRAVYGESDSLPGLIVDVYDNCLCCQFLSAGVEKWKDVIVKCLEDQGKWQVIYDRSDANVREKEGLLPAKGVLRGVLPLQPVVITENKLKFLADIEHGHKTGFYLDQRENRQIMAQYAKKRHVLNCFSYTGAFSLYALRHGAVSVTNIDTSAQALAMGKEHFRQNMELLPESAPDAWQDVEGDVFSVLRQFRAEGRRFDMIILDPPKFAESQAEVMRASRGYKDINLLAFQLLNPNGVLFTFSCSGLMPPDLFQKIVADACLDAGRDARIIRRLSQAADHPISLNFPEASYLKGVVCLVD